MGGVPRRTGASDDQSAQLVLGSVEAKLVARGGNIDGARVLAEETTRLADGTDALNHIANTRIALADVLRMAGLVDEAEQAVVDAIGLFERKGNVVGAAQARDLLQLSVPA